jgi:hypothetical protein
MAEKDTASSPQLEEWKAARDVVAAFDDRLDGLRRYGFTFITGLLTAQSLLESNLILGTSSTGTNIVQPSVKVAVILATMILIIALRLLDRGYIVQQKAAIKRAIGIEKCLNLGLTETIFDAYHQDRLWLFIPVLYGLFAVGAGLLGWFLIAGDSWAEYSIIAATLATLIWIVLIQLIRLEGILHTFDKLKVTKGNKLIVTATNIGETRMLIPSSSFIWHMERQDGCQDAKALSEQVIAKEITLEEDEAYQIPWDTAPEEVLPGFYRFAVKGFDYYVVVVKRLNKKIHMKTRVTPRIIQVLPQSPLPSPSPVSTTTPR